MAETNLEQVTRLADSLSATEKKQLLLHLRRQLQTGSLEGTPVATPAETTVGVWQSKFAESRGAGPGQPEPPGGVASSRVAGLNAGQVWMSDDFNAELPDEFWFGEQ